jgi:hypothetical protein
MLFPHWTCPDRVKTACFGAAPLVFVKKITDIKKKRYFITRCFLGGMCFG